MLKRMVSAISFAAFLLLGSLCASASLIPQLNAGIAKFPDNADLRLYFSTNVSPVSKNALRLAINGDNLEINSVSRLGKNSGVTYLLLVDVSGSMKEHMSESKDLLNAIVSGMGPKDRAEIATVGLNTSIGAFTGSKPALDKKIAALSAANTDTSLYKGIDGCIKLLSAYSSKLTGQEVLVVVSDGGEDDNGGITQQEVTDTVKSSRIPVFTYLTQPQNTGAFVADVSKRFSSFARASAGGVDYSDKQKPAAVGGAILSAVANEYMLNAAMPVDSGAGKVLPLMLTVSAGGVQLNDTYNLTVPDLSSPKPIPNVSTRTIDNNSTPSDNNDSSHHDATSNILKIGTFKVTTSILFIFIIAAAVLIAAATILIVYFRKSKKRQHAAYKETSDAAEAKDNTAVVQEDSFTGVTAAVENTTSAQIKSEPKNAVRVRLIRINNNGKPETFDLRLEDTVTIGRAVSKSDLAFENDTNMSGQHCQLINLKGAVYIADLSSTNGTFVNGVPIADRYKLESDDVINIGTTELRVVIEKGAR